MLSFYEPSLFLTQEPPTRQEVLSFVRLKRDEAGSREVNQAVKDEVAKGIREQFQSLGKLCSEESIKKYVLYIIL